MSDERPAAVRCAFLGYLTEAAAAVRRAPNATLVTVGIEPQRARSANAIAWAERAEVSWFDARGIRESDEFRALLPTLDLLIVGAFGQILPVDLVDAPRLGTLNVHASRLPAYRGGHPIEAQILAGETEGGVTIHWMTEEIDAGPIAGTRVFRIGPHDDYDDVFDSMHAAAGDLLGTLLEAPDAIPRREQPPGETVRPPLRRADAHPDWTGPAEGVVRLVRAYGWRDWIRATLPDGEWTLREVEVVPSAADVEPGEPIEREPVPVVAAGDGALRFVRADDPLPAHPRVAMMQPTFLPWQGYFGLMAAADVFVFLDDFQFVRRSYHQRNRLPTGGGEAAWITVPVEHARSDDRPALDHIRPVLDGGFREKLLGRLRHVYGGAPYFERLFPELERWIGEDHPHLAAMNEAGIRLQASWMDLRPEFRRSSEIGSTGRRSARIADLLLRLGAGTYLAAAGARDYMAEDGVFPVAGVDTRFQQFEPAAYDQGGGDFHPHLSALDALMRLGPRETRRVVERGRRRFVGWDESAADETP